MTQWSWDLHEWSSAGVPADNPVWFTRTQVALGQTQSLQRIIYRSSLAAQVYVPFENPPPTPSVIGVQTLISAAYGPDERDYVYSAWRWAPWRNGWVVSTGLGGILFWTLAEPALYDVDMVVRRAPGIELAHTVTITVDETLVVLGDYDGDMVNAYPQSDCHSSLQYLTADTSIPG